LNVIPVVRARRPSVCLAFSPTSFLSLVVTSFALTSAAAVDGAPVATAPTVWAVEEGEPMAFTVVANDPDGDPIASLTAGGTAIEAGATFIVDASATSGTLSWTPAVGQEGAYSAIFAATNASSDSAMTWISVAAPVSPESNLVGNPSFEISTDGWREYDGSTIERVPGGFGSHGLEVRGPATETDKFSIDDYPNWALSTPRAGTVYRFTAWVRSTESRGRLHLRMRESLGTLRLGTSYSSYVTLTPQWTKVTFDRATLTDNSTIDLKVLYHPRRGGESFQIDHISLVALPGPAGPIVFDDGSIDVLVAPNPFNMSGVIAFNVRAQGPVSIRIFSSTGRLVRTLVNESMLVGRHVVRIDGRDGGGQSLASGVYFYRLEVGAARKTGRFAIVK
jgi:hypothetical protein